MFKHLPLVLMPFVVQALVCAALIGFVLCSRDVPSLLLKFSFLTGTIALTAGDILARSTGFVVWPAFVVLIDMSMILRLESHITICMLAFVLIWILLTTAEDVYRFGMYDLPGTPTNEFRYGKLSPDECDYSALPCKKDMVGATRTGGMSALIFFVDFVATQGFARAVRKEQRTTDNIIETVSQIALYLAEYDLRNVSELLREREALLPPEMTRALRTLESNLQGYIPYLPVTCLPWGESAIAGEKEEDNNLARFCSANDSDFSTTLTLSQSCLSRTFGPPMPKPTRFTLAGINLTLLTANLKGSCALLAESPENLATSFSLVLTAAVGAATDYRGVVDTFVGDKILASFNASRTCATHACSALSVSKEIFWTLPHEISEIVNIGIATGRAFRGEMGCPTMKRFQVIGALASGVATLERASAVLGTAVLVSDATLREGELEHQIRLLPVAVEIGGEVGGTMRAAELLVGARRVVPVQTGQEWIYSLGQGAKEWECFSIAAARILRGGSLKEAATAAGDKAEVLSETYTFLETLCGPSMSSGVPMLSRTMLAHGSHCLRPGGHTLSKTNVVNGWEASFRESMTNGVHDCTPLTNTWSLSAH